MYIKCQKCGKKLTDTESQRRGYGPECWGKLTGVSVKKNEVIGNIFDNPELLEVER